MPYYVGKILELPVTTIQDYSLFQILGSYSTELWRQQIDIIRAQHGLISFIVHPDYLNSDLARKTYGELLEHLRYLRSETGVWMALPGEVDEWWRQRSKMRLVQRGARWLIEGDGAERARVANASLRNGAVCYTVN
jgi:hypothetical protein